MDRFKTEDDKSYLVDCLEKNKRLKNIPGGANPDTMADLAYKRSINAGDFVHTRGDPSCGNSMFIYGSGEYRVVNKNSSGDGTGGRSLEQILAEGECSNFGTGDDLCLGELAMLHYAPPLCDVVCEQGGFVWVIHRHDVYPSHRPYFDATNEKTKKSRKDQDADAKTLQLLKEEKVFSSFGDLCDAFKGMRELRPMMRGGTYGCNPRPRFRLRPDTLYDTKKEIQFSQEDEAKSLYFLMGGTVTVQEWGLVSGGHRGGLVGECVEKDAEKDRQPLLSNPRRFLGSESAKPGPVTFDYGSGTVTHHDGYHDESEAIMRWEGGVIHAVAEDCEIWCITQKEWAEILRKSLQTVTPAGVALENITLEEEKPAPAPRASLGIPLAKFRRARLVAEQHGVLGCVGSETG